MSEKLRVEVVRLREAVMMTVLEQPGGLRGRGELGNYYDFLLWSTNSPCIDRGGLAIRGRRRGGDKAVCFYRFATVQDAEAWQKGAAAAIAAFNQQRAGKSQSSLAVGRVLE